uniref:DH domain-containing protein n=1 Tax=Haptolina ericina TaxID=156174 RepID=A0A7S3C1N5_9EUKA
MEEIVRTERAYVADLSALGTVMAAGLPKGDPKGDPKVDELRAVVESLEQVHLELLHGIETSGGSLAAVASTFAELAPFLRMYSIFCAGYARTLAALTERRPPRATGSELRSSAALATAEAKAGQSVESLLIKPVQRLCKYPLFFSQLLADLPEDSPVRPQLEKVALLIQNVNTEVNGRVREAEAADRLLELHSQLGKRASLVEVGRRLLLELEVWLSPSRRGPSYRLALLSDSVLLASPRSPPITSATAYFRRSSARTLRIKSHAPLTSASLVPPPPPTHAGTAPLCNTLVLVLDCERYELFTRSTTAAQHALEVFSRALVSNAVASSAVGSGASTIESPTASSPASRGACALDSSVAATLQPSHTSKREGVQREGNDGRVQSPSSTALTKGNLQLPPMEHALEQNLTGFDVD